MDQLIASITKEEINTLPVETFEGVIHVVDTIEKLEKALEELKGEKVLGFDTETKPVFAKGRRNQVALLQVASGQAVYLFRLNKLGFPQGLIDVFCNSEVLKVGLSIKDDFLMMRGRHENLDPISFIELQSFVKDYGISDNSLQKIYAIVFGKKLSKAQRLSNWEAEELSAGQKMYAALDAMACRRIYTELTSNYTLGSTQSKA